MRGQVVGLGGCFLSEPMSCNNKKLKGSGLPWLPHELLANESVCCFFKLQVADCLGRSLASLDYIPDPQSKQSTGQKLFRIRELFIDLK